jgi:hypothetical protein
MFKKWANLPHKDVTSCGHVLSSHYLSVDNNTGAYSKWGHSQNKGHRMR